MAHGEFIKWMNVSWCDADTNTLLLESVLFLFILYTLTCVSIIETLFIVVITYRIKMYMDLINNSLCKIVLLIKQISNHIKPTKH